jgi:hypothetical protein
MTKPSNISKSAEWMKTHQSSVRRILALVQLLLGICLIAFGYRTTRDHFYLVREGTRTQGTIVGHVAVRIRHWTGNTYDTAYMPIVQFKAGDQVIHFQDWLGSNSTANLNSRVNVLYSPENPSEAIIDRPIMNWLPWAPCLLVGVFLVLVSVRSSMLSLRRR